MATKWRGKDGPACIGISAIGLYRRDHQCFWDVVGRTFPGILRTQFGPPEYFSLVLLGLMMAVYLSEESIIKGLAMAALGLLLGTVGIDLSMVPPGLPSVSHVCSTV